MTKQASKKGKNMGKYARRRVVKTFKKDHTFEKMLKEINEGKNGRPYEFPNELFIFLFIWRIINRVSYRGLEGVAKSEVNLGNDGPSQQTIFRRINEIRPDIRLNGRVKTEGEVMEVALDGTGLVPSNGGKYLDIRWKVKRGFIRLVILNAIGSKLVLDFAVTTADVGETGHFIPMVGALLKEVGANVKMRVFGDKIFGSGETFGFCERHGIDCIIPVKKNAVGGTDPYGAAAVRQMGGGATLDTFNTIPPDERLRYQILWLEENDYGKRSGVEGVFSVYKRVFGECVMSVKEENIIREVAMKLAIYNEWVLDGMEDI